MEELVVLVTGGSGLVGQCLRDEVSSLFSSPSSSSPRQTDSKVFVFLSSGDADLCDYQAARSVFERHRPDYVVHLAAKVGGLYANLDDCEQLFYQMNSRINENVLKLSLEFKVKRCLSCLSTCIFPDRVTYPLDESKIHSGPPHESNAGYALAKRQVDLINKEYNEKRQGSYFFSIIPTNIYGPNDNFHLTEAHVIPDLIRRAHLAVRNNDSLTVYGSGKPLRQFIYGRDVARLILWALDSFYDFQEPSIILCPEEELSINQLVGLICGEFSAKMGRKLTINNDLSRAEGQFKKTASNGKLRRLLANFQFTPIDVGLRETISWYCSNYPHVRPFDRPNNR